jgi:hypothetical protein
MAHRIVVNVQTGEVTQVEYTEEEQAVYDAAIAAQQAEAQAEISAETTAETPVEIIAEPAQEV